MTAVLDEQARFDQEDAVAFRRAVQLLSARAAKALSEEARRRAAYKNCRKECKYADAALGRLASGEGDDAPDDWLRRTAGASRRAEAAKEAETAARMEWVRAVFARRKMHDELRARMRKQFERFPLFDQARPAPNDHAEPAKAAPSRYSCECGPDCPRSCPCGCHPPALREPVEPIDLCTLHETPAGLGQWRSVPLRDLAAVDGVGLSEPIIASLKKAKLTMLGAIADRIANDGRLNLKKLGKDLDAWAVSRLADWWAKKTEDGQAGKPPPWERQEPEESPEEPKGHRLDRVMLDVLNLLPFVRSRLEGAGLVSVGKLVDLAGKAGKPLAEALAERFVDASWSGRMPAVIHAAAVAWLAANPPPHADGEAHCRSCGCTDADCSRCIVLTGKACRWLDAEHDLCSTCDDRAAPAPPDVGPANVPPAADPLAAPCHKCHAEAGAKCRNYKGRNKQTCPGRGDPDQTGPHGTDPMSGPSEQPRPLFAAAKADYEAAGELLAPPAPEPDGWPWPAGLTEGVLRKAYIETAISRVNRLQPKPATAHPFEWDGQLWVCVAIEPDASIANILPLIPTKDFGERYPQYMTSYYPDRAKLSLPRTDEGRVQWWTGVAVKVGRKEYAIAPAGEARTLIRPKEEAAT